MKPFKQIEYPDLPPDVVGMDLHDEDFRVCIKMYIKLCQDKKLGQRLRNRIRIIEREEKQEKQRQRAEVVKEQKRKRYEYFKEYQPGYKARKKLEKEKCNENNASER